MARFEITGPDGGRYEVTAPDGASEQEVLAYVQQNASAPPSAGRFAQPKLKDSIPEPSMLADVGEQAVRGINRGMNAVIALPGEIFGGAINMIAPGQGDRFKWNNMISEVMTSPEAQPKTDAGRYANSVGQAVGASVIPAAGFMAKAAQAAPAATSTMGAVGQQLVNAYRTAPGAALATDAAAATGAGIGQEVARDLDYGAGGQFVGGMVGGMVPLGAAAVGSRVTDAVGRSPTLARYRAPLEVPDEVLPQSAGAAANPTGRDMTPPITGPDAAAYQQIANTLANAGVKRGVLRQRLDSADTDAIGGVAPLALVDLDNSLQRLAGSVVRQNTEAANRGQRFVAGRQTGITPLEGMPEGSGIPTRQFMESSSPIDPAMGMFERMRDNVRSALQVPQRSAYRVDQDLIDVQRQNSGPAYRRTFDAAQGIDMAPVFAPIVQNWRGAMANEVDRELIGKMRNVIGTVERALSPAGTLSHFERLNMAKKLIDKLIERANKSSEQRSPEVVRALTGMKNDLVSAMDNVPVVGDMYRNARSVFSSTAEMRDALELGRNALREGAEVSADAYRAMTAGEQQMFRIGLADAVERTTAAQKRGADVTQIFQKPSVQELLMEVMPQGSATRLGRNIQTENMTTRTTNEVFGNSKTAQRQADDEAFNQMGDAIEAIRSARSATSATDAGLRALKAIIDRVGGFRQDTAAALANKLFTAERDQLDDIFRQIEARLGPDRTAQFAAMLERYRASLGRQGTGAAATAVTVPPPANRQEQRRTGNPSDRPPGWLPPDPKPRSP